MSKKKAASAAAAAASGSTDGPGTSGPHSKLFFRRDAKMLLIGLAVAVALFSNGVNVSLVFDDHLAIENNKDSYTDRGVSMRDVFLHDFWGHDLEAVASNGSYRPFTMITFRLQYLLAGLRHSPPALHVFNFCVAYLNACLVYYLARLYQQMMLHPPAAHKKGRATASNAAAGHGDANPYSVPLTAMLIFLVHPVHVDSVSSIVGRCELLYCAMGLLSFFAMHAYATRDTSAAAHIGAKTVRHTGGRGSSDGTLAAFARSPIALLALMVGCLVSSILFKDSGVTFAAVFVLHAALLWAWGLTTKSHLVVVTTLSIGLAGAYLVFRRNFIGEVDLSKSKLIRRGEVPQYFIPAGVWHWLSMRWTVQVKNLELLFYPSKLSCEYNYDCIPHMESIADTRFPYYVAVSAALLAALSSMIWMAFARGSRLAVLLLVFILWIVIPYAPVSHLFVQIGTFIAERCLYVPSIGVALIYSFLARPVLSSIWAIGGRGVTAALPAARTVAVLSLAGVWFLISYRRNSAWASDEALFRAGLEVCPNGAKMNYLVARAITRAANDITPAALALFERSMEIDPTDLTPIYHLAVHAWQKEHNATKAIALARRGTLDPFTVTQCYPLMAEMRRSMNPGITPVQELFDDAILLPLASQRAQRFREAALLLKQQDSDPCAPVPALAQALHRWDESGLYWQSDEALPLFAQNTFCNTGYWWAESFESCYLDPQAPPGSKKLTRTLADGTAVPALKPGQFKRALRDVRLIGRKCTTNWAEPGLVRGAIRTSQLRSFGNRLTEFDSLMPRLIRLIGHLAPFAPGPADAQAARLVAVILTMERYCNLMSIMENADVRKTLSTYHPVEVARMRESADGNLGQARQDIMVLWKSNQDLRGTTLAETAELEALKAEIVKLATCSPSLSSVIF